MAVFGGAVVYRFVSRRRNLFLSGIDETPEILCELGGIRLKNDYKTAKKRCLTIITLQPGKRQNNSINAVPFSLLFVPPTKRRRNGGLYEIRIKEYMSVL